MRESDLAADTEQEVVAERKRHPQKKLAVNVVVVVAEKKRRTGEQQRGTQPAEERTHFARSNPVGRSRRKSIKRSSGTPCA